MRRVFLMTLVLLAGCGKAKVETAASSAKPPTDPVAARRDEEEQAAFSLDAAGESIEQALNATKKLAPVAGGDAKEALLDVADMFDSAGATLADHNEAPPPLEEYRKEDHTADRQKTVSDALDALHELRDAQGTLDDLAENVPAEHSKSLDSIRQNTDEAVDAVESAVTRLGGKVPPDEDDDDGDDKPTPDGPAKGESPAGANDS